MGVIKEAFEKLIGEYVRDHGLVLLFDPERDYESVVPGLHAGQDRVLTYAGSFYRLRREAEPLIRGLDVPKLLIYLPVPWEQSREPLAELLALGIDLRPGVSGSRNTRLAVVARKALKGRVADTRIEDLDRQIEQGGLTLSELEKLALEGGTDTLPTALAVHFGTAVVNDAALDFLARSERDNELISRNGLKDWVTALAEYYDLPTVADPSPEGLRKLLARHALICDLLDSLGVDVPEPLSRVVSIGDRNRHKRAAELAKEWRNRRDLAASYPKHAAEVAASLHLDAIEFTDGALERSCTFKALEECLLRRVASQVVKDRTMSHIADSRQRGFWAEQDTALQADWSLVSQAAQLMTCAGSIERVLATRTCTWDELVGLYTGPQNWAELDTLHRRLEKRAASLEFALATPPAEVEQLVLAARRRHEDVAGALAERFIRAWREAQFSCSGHVLQTEIYDRYVGPELLDHSVVYILVDALRWELGRELPNVLGAGFETTIELAIGTAPSITEVGMAALLPSAASGLEIGGASRLQVSLHGQVLRNRADRIAYVKERAGVPVIDLKLEDPRNFRRKLKDLPKGPALVFVTSREIDQSGEDGLTAAREHMERVLTHLGLAMRRLADEGFEKFVVASDHGYLYGEDLGESDKIDLPGGKTLLPHRRVWVGKGGAASASFVLTEVSRFGARSDLEMAVPWNLAGFRTAGPTDYFHGGLSPQEILLPVVLATAKTTSSAKEAKKLTWEITLGSAKITARFVSVRIQARSQSLFAEGWPTVRVEVRTGGEVCSLPNSGTYGFQDAIGAVSLRSSETDATVTEVNTMALMLTNKVPSRGTVSIHLMDAATGVELKKLDNVEVSLAL